MEKSNRREFLRLGSALFMGMIGFAASNIFPTAAQTLKTPETLMPPKKPDTSPNKVRTQDANYEIAFVKTIFTATAYQENGFYKFYRTHADSPHDVQVTDNTLQWLDVPLVDEWTWNQGLNSFITSSNLNNFGINLGTNATVINDLDVHNGILFKNDGEIRYKTVVVGFSEYVTAKQYSEYRRFVENGGKLILLDANFFLTEVDYRDDTNRLRLMKGHGWSFDGQTARKNVFRRWEAENFEWTGSNYMRRNGINDGAIADTNHPISVALRLQFGKHLFQDYSHHEENTLRNPNAKIIAEWRNDMLDGKIATYELKYGKGVVFHTGIFGDDIIAHNKAFQFLLLRMIKDEGSFEGSKVRLIRYDADDSDSRRYPASHICLYNATDKTLDISNWKIAVEEQVLHIFPEETLITPRTLQRVRIHDDVALTNDSLLLLDSQWIPQHELKTEAKSEKGKALLFETDKDNRFYDDYFRLYNTGSKILDISNWRIFRGQDLLYVFPEATLVSPKASITVPLQFDLSTNRDMFLLFDNQWIAQNILRKPSFSRLLTYWYGNVSGGHSRMVL